MNRIANGNNLTMPPAAAQPQVDKTKDWQLEILMEKLRSKSGQYKTLPEISKNVRMAMLDKRYALDSVEKSQHQKCLDTLQHSIKVTSLQSMVERLESLTRQLGLKFMVGPSGVELFISSDMFYLEIVLDQTGAVKDVKVHHESKMEQQSCAELVNCLSRGDFADFTAQLEGFASIYQLNAEKKIKCKAFTALQLLESDLSTLDKLQMVQYQKDMFGLLHKSPVGILEKRRGGHPMKLTYFVSPYDLISVEKCDLEPINVETITSRSLGYSVTVCMEGSATHKLQTTNLITVNRNTNGKGTPSFSPLSTQNSAAIPACFVLKLNKPMPMCLSLVRQIQQLTELDSIEQSVTHPLLSLIVRHSSEGKMESGNNKGLFVTLPDQNHCYFLTENKTMNAVMVHSIQFTHPANVSQILKILRQQALFNTIINSCVRPKSKQDFENMTMFEITALSHTHLSISMEHPLEDSMATAEIDLSEVSNLLCTIRGPGLSHNSNNSMLLGDNNASNNGGCAAAAGDPASELSTKILNKSFSIPVTMRAVIKFWEKQQQQQQIARPNGRNSYNNGGENFSLPLGSGDPGGPSSSRSGPAEFGGLDTTTGASKTIKQEPSTASDNCANNSDIGGGHNSFLNESIMAQSVAASSLDSNSNGSNNSAGLGNTAELALAGGASSAGDKSGGIGGGSSSSGSVKRQHGKRSKSEDQWKSSKRKTSAAIGQQQQQQQQQQQDDNCVDMLMETSSSDSTSRSTPLSQQEVDRVGTPLGFFQSSDAESSQPAADVSSTGAVSGVDNKPAEDFPGGSADDTPATVDETLVTSRRSNSKKSSPSSHTTGSVATSAANQLLADLGEKNLVPPSVSITPIAVVMPTQSSAGFGDNNAHSNGTPSGGSSDSVNVNTTSAAAAAAMLSASSSAPRPRVEIIPLASSGNTAAATAAVATLPSSITITPISSGNTKSSSIGGNNNSNSDEKIRSSGSSGSASSDKKSSKNKSSSSSSSSEDNNKSRVDKKRKRKRDESPMGPPEKIPPNKQDPLTKPVTVSITKPSGETPSTLPSGGALSNNTSSNSSSSSSSNTPNSPSLLRKFNASSSPTHRSTSSSSSSSISGKLSPNLIINKTGVKSSSTGSTSSSHNSPKHSPAHVSSSPKHQMSSGGGSSGAVGGSSSNISSPKHGSSPKHPSTTSGSGKPSLSALKSAATAASNSPSSGKNSASGDSNNSKSTSKSSSSTGSTKDSSSSGKDKKSSGLLSGGSATSSGKASKSSSSSSSSAKLNNKPLDLNADGLSVVSSSDGLSSPSSNAGAGQDLSSKSSGSGSSSTSSSASSSLASGQAQRNRKGSLSAIVDKLKSSAQHCDGVTDLSTANNSTTATSQQQSSGAGSSAGTSSSTKSSSGGGTKERSSSSSTNSSAQLKNSTSDGTSKSTKSSTSTSDSSSSGKNSEYMVKPSSDGIKITINKTRTKDSTSSASSGGNSSSLGGTSKSTGKSGNTGSPKTHTGLKPGVNSGPASKKPQNLGQKTAAGGGGGSSSSNSVGGGGGSLSNSTSASGGGTTTTSSSSSSSGGGAAGLGGSSSNSGSNYLKGSSSKAPSSSSKNSTSGAPGGTATSSSPSKSLSKTSNSGNSGSTSSSSSSSNNSNSSSNSATDLSSRSSNKDRSSNNSSNSNAKLNKNSSASSDGSTTTTGGSGNKSIFAKDSLRKPGPNPNKEDSAAGDNNVYGKMAKLDAYSAAPLMMEGLMKQLDKSFQIPKLSARSSASGAGDQDKKSKPDNNLNNVSRSATADAKIFDMINKNPSSNAASDNLPSSTSISSSSGSGKYPSIANKNASSSYNLESSKHALNNASSFSASKLSNKDTSSCSVVGSSGAHALDDGTSNSSSSASGGGKSKDLPQNLSQQSSNKDDNNTASYNKTNYGASKNFSSSGGSSSSSTEPLSLSTKSVDLTAKFAAPLAPSASSHSNKDDCSGGGGNSSANINKIKDSNNAGGNSASKASKNSQAASDGGAATSSANSSEGLLDFSSTSKLMTDKTSSGGGGNSNSNLSFPQQSPSVSVHIVKSPATSSSGPSPIMINPSPHSLTDDELMDEAVIGLGK